MATVTICPPAPPREGLSFDTYNFERRRSKNTGLDYNSFEKMSIRRVSDLRLGRRYPVPDWALGTEGLQRAVVQYLEKRLFIQPNPSHDLKARLARCQQKARADAAPTRHRLEKWIRNYRAIANAEYHEADRQIYTRHFLASLRGEGCNTVLKGCSKHVRNLDSELFTQERVAEIVLSILFLYHRMGWDSPSIANHLGIKAPHCRQILCRVSKRVRKTDAPIERPAKSLVQ